MAEPSKLQVPTPAMSPEEKGALLLCFLAARRPVVSWNEEERRWDLLDFSGALLSGADLRSADLRWVDFSGVRLDGADLRGADLTRASLGGADLRRAHLEGAQLGGADLRETQLEGAVFTEALLDGVNLQRADLRGALLDRARLIGAHLDGANLADTRLRGARLERSSLEGADLRAADLRGARLGGASLNGADLRGANLEEGSLRGARLRKARLGDARLGGADLRGANVQDADLAGADLVGADCMGAIYNAATRWPQGFEPPMDAYEIGPDVVLQAADLEGADLSGADLSGANLEGAKLDGAKLDGAKLSGAELVHASFARASLEECDLEGANLAGATMNWARLRLANLRWANLSRVSLERASLEGAHLRGADLVGALLERADLQGANMSEVYLNEADLRGANLQLANLEDAHIRGTNLWEADLRGARLKGLSGFPQDLEDCKISSLTYTESAWTLSEFLRWYQAGVDITDLENFPAGVQEWFRDNREGLVLYFRTALDRVGHFLLDGVIIGLLGPDTDCVIERFERVDKRTVVRISSRRQADLGALGELFYRRPWERPDSKDENARLVRQLQEVLQGRLLGRLSVLMDQSERAELWGFQEGELVQLRTWQGRQDRQLALRNLLRDLLSTDELLELLELRPESEDAVPGAEHAVDLAAEVVRVLDGEGILDQPFFLQLREERPTRWRDVRYVAQLWGVDASEDVLLGEVDE